MALCEKVFSPETKTFFEANLGSNWNEALSITSIDISGDLLALSSLQNCFNSATLHGFQALMTFLGGYERV